ncbi:MAG: ribosome biogenesis GTPase YlqF [Clostridiales Family XIII bacterium]|jgi:ribosome biogenesis GTPase A|nr:ribosome biogenesis GTPase YlqF [Clostridiales Family XIII bacterium]
MENINWYPGHMKKTRELIASNLKMVDVVIEVCDARIPDSSRNPILSEITAGKARILVLNKMDLADEDATGMWLDHYRRHELNQIRTVIALNSEKGEGVPGLLSKLQKIEDERSAARNENNPGIGRASENAAPFRRRPLRIMIVGVPNSGKSSLINRLTGKKSTMTGDRPGVTKGKQWLTLQNGMQLLDTPGILWPKFEDPHVGLNLAFCGSIRDEVMDSADLGLELLRVLMQNYSETLAKRYGVEITGETDETVCDDSHRSIGEDLRLMERIAKKRGLILPGNRIDYERTGRMLLSEFREGRIGRITLERPNPI